MLPQLAISQTFFDEDEDALLGIYGDEEMISIAIGDQQLISKAPAVASVITNETIESLGLDDLDEVLETIPGLHVSYSNFYTPIYTFRGIRSAYNPEVLMLINGFPITNLFHGDRNLAWGGMPLEAIERIEVIRGPGSAVYGADAFAGVINIITKGGKDIQKNSIGFKKGSYSTEGLWLASAWNLKGFDIGLTVEFVETDGDDSIVESDAQTLLDSFQGTNASLAPGKVSRSRESYDLRFDVEKNRWRTRLGLQRRKNIGSGAGGAEALDPSSRYSSDRINWDMTYHNTDQFEGWDLTAELAYFSADQVNEKPLHLYPAGSAIFGVAFPDGIIGNPDVWEKNYRANFNSIYSGFASHKFRFGFGYHYGEIYKTAETKNFGINPSTGLPLLPGSPLVDVSDTPYIFLQEQNRENYYAFIQYIWQVGDDWEVTLGDRYDHYSDFGSTTNPRAALVWSASQNLTVKLLYGKAFRAPAFGELFAINNPIALGNPNLSPEEIENYEIAFDYHPSNDFKFTFNLFEYSWRSIIEFVPNIGGLTAENIGKKSGYGLEAEINWDITNSISFLTNYSWIKGKDETHGEDGWDFPQQQFYISALWKINSNWGSHIQLNHVMDRDRHFNDTRDPIDDYTQVDLVTSYTINFFTLKAKIKNLFDDTVKEPSTYVFPQANIQNDLPLPGRNYLIETRFSF